MAISLGPRRGTRLDVTRDWSHGDPLSAVEVAHFEELDRLYRALCAILYNYVPKSGHPGGSISSGRFVEALLFEGLEYDVSRPEREDADVLTYAAGHKAMGLYSIWALRDEVMRLGAPELVPDLRYRLRLEDLFGFRRNPVTRTPLFQKARARALDGHPTPQTPFVRLATGASGVGLTSAIGFALGARDYFGENAPRIHVVEGEGGLTPGRASEALAAAGTASLGNVVVHVDWNQSSIDSDRVCREGESPGEYVQWTPAELFLLHDWNAVEVPDGHDFQQVFAARRLAATLDNAQPTAIIYRTRKGWQYGIEGRASHGAGHDLCSGGFYQALADLTDVMEVQLPSCDASAPRCADRESGPAVREACFSDALAVVRRRLESLPELTGYMARRLEAARDRLDAAERTPREDAPRVEAVYDLAASAGRRTPKALALEAGQTTTLRGELGRALQQLNRVSGGALMVGAADLLGSTSVKTAADGFPGGYWHATTNPGSRLVAVGGICEDALSGVMSGLSSFGHHIGVGASYGAFLAPLGHIASRLHGIGAQARRELDGTLAQPMILIAAHAGLKTGEDGPTHADPQCLQLLQGNFPPGVAVTLTPWEPREIWPLLCSALAQRPALVFPVVTRPGEMVLDREAFGLAPPEAAADGLYLLRRPEGRGQGTLVLQGSDVTYAFVTEVLPRLESEGIHPWVYSVSSAELFDALPEERRRQIYPEERAREAMGITGFTLPTMERWLHSERGRAMTLHPFARGGFLGSGEGPTVLAEAGLDGPAQYEAIRRYVRERRPAA